MTISTFLKQVICFILCSRPQSVLISIVQLFERLIAQQRQHPPNWHENYLQKKRFPVKELRILSLSLSGQRWMFFNCCWKVDCTTIGADTAAVSCVWLSSQVDSAGERQSWVFPFFPVKVVLDYLEFKIIKWAGHVGWFWLLVVQQRGRRHLLARIIFRSNQWINIY